MSEHWELEEQIKGLGKRMDRLEDSMGRNSEEHRCFEVTDAKVTEQLVTIFKALAKIESQMDTIAKDVKKLLLGDGEYWCPNCFLLGGVTIMKYFKDTAGNVYAYNDIQIPKEGLAPLTEAEVEAHLNPVIPEEFINQNKIMEAQQYLNDTDWIVVKINELQLRGLNINTELIKYNEELNKRAKARELIRELRNT